VLAPLQSPGVLLFYDRLTAARAQNHCRHSTIGGAAASDCEANRPGLVSGYLGREKGKQMSSEDAYDDGHDDDYDDAEEEVDEEEEVAPCPQCGAEIFVDAEMCTACGHWLSVAERHALWSGGSQSNSLLSVGKVVLIVVLIALMSGLMLF
jgi:hypothetical protein